MPGDKVISYHQSGGVTAHTVNVNQAPRPELRIKEVFSDEKCEPGYRSRFALHVRSPYPPARLCVAVSAPSVTGIELIQPGLSFSGHSGTRDGMAFDTLMNPHGQVHLDVFTSQPGEALKIDWEFG